MKRIDILAVTFVITSLGTGSAVAGDIYRYTDAQGEVHYVDRPTGAPSEELMGISSKPTNPAQVQARAAARNTQRGTVEDDEPEEDAPTRAERARVAKQQAKQCQQYRDQLETYVTSRRLYREDANGERDYLDEKEVQEARSKLEEQIVEDCS